MPTRPTGTAGQENHYATPAPGGCYRAASQQTQSTDCSGFMPVSFIELVLIIMAIMSMIRVTAESFKSNHAQ